MKKVKINLLGHVSHTTYQELADDCPECGQEMEGVVFFGEVCTNSGCISFDEPTISSTISRSRIEDAVKLLQTNEKRITKKPLP